MLRKSQISLFKYIRTDRELLRLRRKRCSFSRRLALQPAKMLELADREKSDSIAFLELFLTKTILGQTSCFLSRNFFVSLFPADAKISRAQKRDTGKIQKDPSLRFPSFNRTVLSLFIRYKFHRKLLDQIFRHVRPVQLIAKLPVVVSSTDT